jgi:hypothetical protein
MKFAICLLAMLAATLRAATVQESATPERGIQPRAIVEADGTLHLVWYRGDAGGGDLFYARQPKGASLGKAQQINSEPKSAVSTGTIRGAQVVLGRAGKVHVVWNGARDKNDKNSRPPFFYTRLEAGKPAFEPQRAMSGNWIMDGGGAVAADHAGHVFVFWHGGDGSGEGNRRILVRVSSDDGQTFGEERMISPEGDGVCGCCAMQALATDDGGVYVLYRTASDGGKMRNIQLLSSRDAGKTFSSRVLDPWAINACPMSSMSLAATSRGVLGAWETSGQIRFGYVDKASSKEDFLSMPKDGAAAHKFPSIAVGPDGQLAVAWSEGAGWEKRGALAWQLMDADLHFVGNPSRSKATNIAVWSFPCIVSQGGGFTVYY